MDKETAKQITRTSEIAETVKSHGWGEVKMMLFDKIMELNDITTLAEADPSKLMIIIAAKQEAVKILMEWLNDVEGIAKSSDFLRKQFLEKQKADFIMKFDDSGQDY